MCFGVVGCGGNDVAVEETTEVVIEEVYEEEVVEEVVEEVTEEEVVEEVVEEVEIVDIGSSIAGSVWYDADGMVYDFSSDMTTLTFYMPDGEVYEGTYLLEADTEGNCGLSMSIESIGFYMGGLLVGSTEDTLEFMDVETGETFSITEFVAEEVEATNVNYELEGSVWVDDDFVVYGFMEENQLLLAFPDGTQTYGEFLLETVNDVYYFSYVVPDMEVAVTSEVTEITPDGLIYTDLTSGIETVLVPYVE